MIKFDLCEFLGVEAQQPFYTQNKDDMYMITDNRLYNKSKPSNKWRFIGDISLDIFINHINCYGVHTIPSNGNIFYAPCITSEHLFVTVVFEKEKHLDLYTAGFLFPTVAEARDYAIKLIKEGRKHD